MLTFSRRARLKKVRQAKTVLRLKANSIRRKLGGYTADAVEKLRRLLWPRPARLAPVLATALLSLVLLPAAASVSVGSFDATSLSPAGIYQVLGSSAQQVYSLGTSLANDLRLIYQLHSRLGAQATATAQGGSVSHEGEIINCTASAPSAKTPQQQQI